ncbi:hypothetical protein F3Y22_tig00110597pilonHSYRG00992 [Hibiscus syriacus]|uniref:Protein BZR1 homolog n=1 Tax=Hibiscus syriacus TaxID=106335 RepID=A0A6A3A4A0_HIBSY|nr:hypothetical protein F3Y22_tig00110597pilonHSYRG00992 [Hibiscus syriacus]
MEPIRPSQHRRTSGLAATAAAGAASVNPISSSSGPDGATTFSYSSQKKRERENEKEKTKYRKRNRRAFTSRMLAGLRQYGNFHLSARSNMNDVLAALAREAGWIVEADGTTYRQSPTPQNQQLLRGNSVRSSESPLSSRRLENCSAKASLDCQSHTVRIDVNGRSPSQGGTFRTEMLPSAEAKPARSEADDHHGIKKIITKGYSNEKSSEVARGRRNGYQNWWKEGHTNGSNRCRSGCISLFIENLPEKIHWKRLESLFSTYGHVINAFIPNKRNSKGGRFGFIRFATIEEARKAISSMNGVHIYDSRIRVSLAKYKPQQSYWRKSSKVVQRKSGMKEIPRIKHCEVEGVVDEEKLHILSNILVGWCKNFIKIGNLANQIQAKGLAGFTLMRAVGNVVLMVFEDSNSLRNVKDDKLETLAKWFSKVETWSESLMVESRRVWLVCEGIPFHAWNWDTLKNIAKMWGKLIAIDNSCEFPSSFDRAKIQILTNAQGRINELFELKVGDHLFKILVHEVDPSFKPNSWVPEDCDISLELDPPIGL